MTNVGIMTTLSGNVFNSSTIRLSHQLAEWNLFASHYINPFLNSQSSELDPEWQLKYFAVWLSAFIDAARL